MNILIVGSEAAPFIKTGGLADVLGSLPAALVRLGQNVAVVLPRYRATLLPANPDTRRTLGPIQISVGPNLFSIAIEEVTNDNVRYFFVDSPPLYARPGIYNDAGTDYADNHIRFAALCQAALAIARWIFPVDIFHAHDWQGGLLGPYLRTRLAHDPTYFGSRVVFTIHNLGYQGLFPAAAVPDLGLSSAQFHSEGMEFWGLANFLKAGIMWSDAITTVSPTYAHEIQTPAFGFGLDGVLRSHSNRLTGILNGVDYSEWSPETDVHLPVRYSVRSLDGKRECKRELLAELGLPSATEDLRRPLLAIVSRFAEQKGLELVTELGSWLAAQDVFLAVLGSGDAAQEAAFRNLAASRPARFAVRIGYNNGLAHRIEAGADVFLMPSRYEPCGLNQIYSQRYGTIPVVRATGGLDDTVDEDTGFKFADFSALAFSAALREALAAYRNSARWAGLMEVGMARDFSWDVSAKRYNQLYESL